MKSSVERINSVQRRLTIELPSEIVSQAFTGAWHKLQRSAQIQGFRPGKAPVNLVKKLYGDRVGYEVSEGLIKEHLAAALREHEVSPIETPLLEEAPVAIDGQPYAFKVLVDVLPELDFDDYRGLIVTVESSDVQDKDVSQEIENIRRSHAKTKNVLDAAAAHDGHLARISMSATLDGQPVEPLQAKSLPVALGHGEWIPELEKLVYGMKPGEDKDATVNFPSNTIVKQLAGKDVNVHIHLEDLKELVMPEIDDEFAKDLGLESASQLRERVQGSLEARLAHQKRQKIEGNILDQILERHKFEVPPSMVERVIDEMIQDIGWPNEQEKKKAMDDSDLRQRFHVPAKRRAQNSLVLWHIAHREKLDVAQDEIDKYIVSAFPQQQAADMDRIVKLRDLVGPRIKERILLSKAMDFLVNQSKVTEIPRVTQGSN